MGDRFYTEGNDVPDEDSEIEIPSDDEQDIYHEQEDRVQTHQNLGLEGIEYADKRRVHTHEANYEPEELNVLEYKGIYYGEEVGDNEK